MVAKLSAESEFRAMAQEVCELIWFKIVLENLKIKWDGPIRLYCDKKSTITIANNQVQHDIHFIEEKQGSGMICTPCRCPILSGLPYFLLLSLGPGPLFFFSY